MWLANGIPGEFGYICWQVELDMSYVAANGIPREIGCMCWQVEFGMGYMAGQWHS